MCSSNLGGGLTVVLIFRGPHAMLKHFWGGQDFAVEKLRDLPPPLQLFLTPSLLGWVKQKRQ